MSREDARRFAEGRLPVSEASRATRKHPMAVSGAAIEQGRCHASISRSAQCQAVAATRKCEREQQGVLGEEEVRFGLSSQ